MEESTERQIAHLAMIQAIIARMAANSFALKTLTVTLIAGFIALLGSVDTPKSIYFVAAALPLVVFWWLDAAYLRLERLYRRLFDGVSSDRPANFSMNVSDFQSSVPSTFRIAFSWSVASIYLMLSGVLGAVAIGMLR